MSWKIQHFQPTTSQSKRITPGQLVAGDARESTRQLRPTLKLKQRQTIISTKGSVTEIEILRRFKFVPIKHFVAIYALFHITNRWLVFFQTDAKWSFNHITTISFSPFEERKKMHKFHQQKYNSHVYIFEGLSDVPWLTQGFLVVCSHWLYTCWCFYQLTNAREVRSRHSYKTKLCHSSYWHNKLTAFVWIRKENKCKDSTSCTNL